MKIHLPNSAWLGNIDPFIRSFDHADPDTLEITSHEKWISIHPVALTMVAALGMTVPPANIRFGDLTATSKHYLVRMHLFDLLRTDVGMSVTAHEPAGRFVPLTQIQHSQELTEFITEMIPLLHLPPEHARPIQYIVSELIRNVLEHSQSEHGAIVAAQYYRKSNTIRIGIADTGIGIKRTITASHPASTHSEAIRLALTPGITGTTSKEGGTEFNAGAGLFFIKSIAKVNRDFFMIYSGDSMYKLLREHRSKIRLYADPFRDKHSKIASLPFWQGTVVGIDITLDSTEEFSKLLDLIHEVYVVAVKERKQERRVKPRFT